MKLITSPIAQPAGLLVSFELDHLDAGNSKAFKDAIQPMLTNHHLVVLDMAKLNFVDSSGLGVLLSCLRTMNNKQGQLKLVHMSNPVRAVFELVRMHRIFSIHNTVDEAFAAT